MTSFEMDEPLDFRGDWTLLVWFEGERRSEVYSSLFRFFPRFSTGVWRDTESSAHRRRGPAKSRFEVEGRNRSGSPVKSMDSITSNGDVASLRFDRIGVAFGRVLFKDDWGGSRNDSDRGVPR